MDATQTTAVAIFEPQNVQAIVEVGPAAYKRNTRSHTDCLAAGYALLDRVEKEGMGDQLDKEMAAYIEKAKVTLKNMNLRRSPITKLFDQLRSAYTMLENEVDPAKAGTVANQIQAIRNDYAAKKREEAERLRREEAARQAALQARQRYSQEVEEDYKQWLNRLVSNRCSELSLLERSLTLDNAPEVENALKTFPAELPTDWASSVICSVSIPLGLDVEEGKRIRASVLAGLAQQFAEQYAFEVGGTRDDILDRVPSKKAELRRMEAAGAEEAERIKADIKAREEEEARRKEQERIERERQEKAAAELAARKVEMDGLFGFISDTTPAYTPKTSVRKRIVLETANDIMAVVAFWWSQEGQALPLDDLAKIFKKQITFAEKAANDKANPAYVTGVRYEDEVKAK